MYAIGKPELDAIATAFSRGKLFRYRGGEGGAVLTNDLKTFQRALIHHDGGCVFRKHAAELNVPFFCGSNFRVSEIQGAIMWEQLKRLDGILKTLRQHKLIMLGLLGKSQQFRLIPSHDLAGDCGTHVGLLFESGKESKAFLDAHTGQGLGLARPIDTDRHVYVNWEPIMKQRAHHPRLNPFKLARRNLTYTPDMCAPSLDVMARVVYISVPYKKSAAQVRTLTRRLSS